METMAGGASRDQAGDVAVAAPSPSEACGASKSKRMTSDSERLSTTCSCILALHVSRGFWEPGVSTKIAWYPGPLRTPLIGLRVVWGRDEGDGDLPADEPVDQGALADVGPAYRR